MFFMGKKRESFHAHSWVFCIIVICKGVDHDTYMSHQKSGFCVVKSGEPTRKQGKPEGPLSK